MTTIHLIGIGTVPAKPAGDLAVGDRLIYNYGYIYEITAIERVTATTLRITERNVKTGEEFTIKKRTTTLVGVAR